jgi:hypothetical protein
LHLHERIDASADLLVQNLLDNSDELKYTYFACVSIIKELAYSPKVFKRNFARQVVQNVDKLLPREETSLVDVNSSIELNYAQSSPLNTFTDLLHYGEHLLQVGHSL